MADDSDFEDFSIDAYGSGSPDHKVDLGPLPTFPGYLFRQAHIRTAGVMHPVLSEWGIRATQFGVLIVLRYNPGLRPSEVAGSLGLKRANFVPLLEELRERGLTETLPRPEDRRARALYLTPAGLELITKLEAVVGDNEKKIMDKIDPEHTGALAAMVAKLPMH